MERIPVIAGNWKMNTTSSEGLKLAEDLKSALGSVENVEIIIAPPFTHLSLIGETLSGSNIKLASQNVHARDAGAYTGEISPLMVKESGCEYAIIGHSERRQYYGETDESVNEKLMAAISHDIVPIVCVGETLEERESGKTLDVIKKQLINGLKDLSKSQCSNIILAYEPVWAIGTGKTASKEEAEEVHQFIRDTLEASFGSESAASVRILYGGSVKPENIDDLMSQKNIDGALVGGASLNAESFIKLVNHKKG